MTNHDPIIQLQCDITEANCDVVTLLAQRSGLSKQTIKSAMQKGAVWSQSALKDKPQQSHIQIENAQKPSAKAKRLRRAKKSLPVGHSVYLYYNRDILDHKVEAPVLIEDFHDYSIWFKPYGVLCQGSKWGDHSTINRLVEQQLSPSRPVFVMHRLDKATQGLIVLAHSKRANQALTQLFESRQIKKTYRAWVNGSFPDEVVSIDAPIDSKPAHSHVSLITTDPLNHLSFVEINIETGRKHQIRKHLSSIGHAIIGDRLHGDASKQDMNLQLSAHRLQFICPLTQEQRDITLPQRLQLASNLF